MDHYLSGAYAAAYGVLRNAASLRAVVEEARAKDVEARARYILERLDASDAAGGVTAEIADMSYWLASASLGMVDAIDIDPDSISLPGMVWGFSLAVARIIAFALAGAASCLAVRVEEASQACAASAHITESLLGLAEDLDLISVHIYGGLCRLAVSDADEMLLVEIYRNICVWALAIQHCLAGPGGMSGELLWGWASGDPLWALVLVKGVLALQPTGSESFVADPQLLVPANLQQLKEAALQALAGLPSPVIAHREEANAGFFADDAVGGGCTMDVRQVIEAVHRARLAVAASDTELLATALVAVAASPAPESSVPPLAAFFAAVAVAAAAGDASVEAWAEVAAAQAEECGPQEDVFSLQDAQGVADALAAEVSMHVGSLWRLLSRVPPASAAFGGGAGYLRHCAALALVAPPGQALGHTFLAACFAHGAAAVAAEPPAALPAALAALVAVAVNCGLEPAEGDWLTNVLAGLVPEQTATVASQLARGRRVGRLLRGGGVPASWAGLLTAAAAAAGEAEPEPGPPPLLEEEEARRHPRGGPCGGAGGEDRPAPALASGQPSVRQLIRGAPRELCCALDGKLLMDPVRSPYGDVFERGTLARFLAAAPAHLQGLCPLRPENPLRLEDCFRDGDARLAAVRWVRQSRPAAAARAAR